MLGVINGGEALRGGTYTYTVNSGGVQDIAGNALDGEFYGFFPSGNNIVGGNFVAVLDSVHNRIYSPSPQQGFGSPVQPPGRLGLSYRLGHGRNALTPQPPAFRGSVGRLLQRQGPASAQQRQALLQQQHQQQQLRLQQNQLLLRQQAQQHQLQLQQSQNLLRQKAQQQQLRLQQNQLLLRQQAQQHQLALAEHQAALAAQHQQQQIALQPTTADQRKDARDAALRSFYYPGGQF